MTKHVYRKPPWFLRAIGNRLAPLNRDVVSVLSVRGRKSGQLRSTPVVVLDHDGERYLVTPYGDTEWVRNLRAAGEGQIKQHGRTEEFTAVEVPVDQRPPIIEAYLRKYGRMPTVARSFAQLPDPAHHPTFRITSKAA
ncbi:MAG: nitroreductase family deazaflavin-dependent oxidoreductase [Micromonosporaceae bacterium]|nr:nitroreductase family deazaflavin-dependent oxidoreductase [Micromonosporaceae bacterium]